MNEDERKTLEDIKDELIKMTKLVSDLIEGMSTHDMSIDSWKKDRTELWCRIYNEGGIITKERTHEIWEKEMGKDVRGLGGFFVGKKASLQWTAHDKVVLTSNAKEAIEAWTGKSIDEYAKKFKNKK